MTSERKLSGKRALVTGSGTGIGREIGLEFCRQGADVAFHYSNSAQGALSAVKEAKESGATRVTALKADFRMPEAPAQLVRGAIQFLGGLDVLVNNAGITMNVPLEQVTPEQFDTVYNVNIRAMFFAIQAAVPTMVQQSGGVVINLSSIHAFEAYPEHAVYGSTKGAINALTRILAIELAPKGIRVNAIAPGAVEVEAHHRIFPDYDAKGVGEGIPCGFVGQPIDIARVGAFLASDDARYVVGQTIVVDGGTTSWMPFGDGFRQPMGGQFGRGYVPGL